MAIPGETGHVGKTCSDCGIKLVLQVLRSNAGYYLGTFCNCGPYSRETEYFSSEKEANEFLKLFNEEHHTSPVSVVETDLYKE